MRPDDRAVIDPAGVEPSQRLNLTDIARNSAKAFPALAVALLIGSGGRDHPAARPAGLLHAASGRNSYAGAEILRSSAPADGAVLSRPPAELRLTFIRPARLLEVVVASADGQTIPMMLSPAGPALTASVPLPDLEPGAYRATWRALGASGQAQGMIRFTIRK